MRRSLFAREFRSALVPNLVTVGAILATLVVLERLYGLRLGKAEDVRSFTDVALVIGLVVSGFISGERCFPAELKESRMLFLSSLPISRTWTWLAIVSARLLVALASLALAVALRRPSVLPDSRDLLRLGIILVALAFVAYILFFSAGTLFALLFRRTLFSYVLGFLVLGILLGETLVSYFYSTVPPYPGQLAQIPEPTDSLYLILYLTQIVAFLSLLLVLSLLLSWRFFLRGEIGNPKRRIRNQILFGLTAMAYLWSSSASRPARG
jgi:multisubunit Na+/H+ antiporter MnhC subunit